MSTVMFIHGAWLTPAAWDLFRGRFEEKGFQTLAPPWPYEDVPIEQLRRSPHRAVNTLTIKQIVDHYDARIRALPERPILVGHSFGGLFVQLLLDRGLGAAGVAIDPVPIRGVLPTSRALRSALPVLSHWNGWKEAVPMTFEQFVTDFAQTLPKAQMREVYDRYIVPTPGLLYWQAAFSIGNKVHVYNPDRPPLLLMAGEADLTIEASMVRATYAKQRKARSETAFKAFPGRSHFLIHEPGWEEVADYAIDWIGQLAPLVEPEPVPVPVRPVEAPLQGVPAL
jgi:pimeloyl-ACP methyl ester carboxylesterase